ncbi:MAG: nucleotidyltransferase family protein [Labilithrix sp.]|nr:nucleotidyltransferase family protein [Labilithrix sp.]
MKDVLVALERGSSQVVLVIDDRNRLAGILTDGDVRRAFLKGASLSSPVEPHVNSSFIAVDPRVGRVDVLELMKARRISVVPIVDEGGTALGIHRLHDVVRAERRENNWAVVMAGGRGTRLGSLTDRVPKPMVRVAGRPILERLILHLAGFGVERIFVAINYLGHVVEEHFGDGHQFGCSISYLREERYLGTGGALSLLPDNAPGPLLVVNGDLVTSADIGALLRFHEAHDQVATIGVRSYVHNVPFGCVEMDGDRVLRFEEKPTVRRIVNAGMYVIDPVLVSRVPKDEEFQMPALIEDALRRGESVRGHEVQGDWIDVGQRDQLITARGGV